jgi:hypothetical protein
VDVRVEIALLALEIGDVHAAAAQQLAQLLHAGAVDLVEVEQLLDLGQREAEPLAAQDPGSRTRSCALYSRVRPWRRGLISPRPRRSGWCAR